MSIYDIHVETIQGDDQKLSDYRGKLMLIVNTASQCGFTPQYKGLQRLHETYKEQGLVVLGFPCNQFNGQEPGNEASIAQFCELNHGVTFPLHAKIQVKGPDIHPLYQHLTRKAPGFLGLKTVKWNFTKFLVNQKGEVVKRFAPTVTPDRIEGYIQQMLEKKE